MDKRISTKINTHGGQKQHEKQKTREVKTAIKTIRILAAIKAIRILAAIRAIRMLTAIKAITILAAIKAIRILTRKRKREAVSALLYLPALQGFAGF